jgi:hypothetical protein
LLLLLQRDKTCGTFGGRLTDLLGLTDLLSFTDLPLLSFKLGQHTLPRLGGAGRSALPTSRHLLWIFISSFVKTIEF